MTYEQDFQAETSVSVQQFKNLKDEKREKTTFGIIGMSLIPHFGWKPIPKNPIPISSATALTYKHDYMEIITDLKVIRSLVR